MPFLFSRRQAESIPQGWKRQAVLSANTWPVPGCISVEDQGCGYYTMLVTSGGLAGTVWDALDDVWDEAYKDYNEGSSWLPARIT